MPQSPTFYPFSGSEAPLRGMPDFQVNLNGEATNGLVLRQRHPKNEPNPEGGSQFTLARTATRLSLDPVRAAARGLFPKEWGHTRV